MLSSDSPVATGAAVIQDPVQLATEGALWGSVQAHGFLRDAVLLSDDAGQFDVGRHALCWVHAERLVHRLDTFTDRHRAAQQHMRKLIWNFYADLKAYRVKPDQCRRRALRARFDRIFRRRTGFVTLDRLLKRLWANKPELLMVLERPEIPLHTNGRGDSKPVQMRLPGRRISKACLAGSSQAGDERAGQPAAVQVIERRLPNPASRPRFCPCYFRTV